MNKSQEAGSERKTRRKVQGEVVDYQEEQSLSEELHESGCQEVA